MDLSTPGEDLRKDTLLYTRHLSTNRLVLANKVRYLFKAVFPAVIDVMNGVLSRKT